MKAELEKVNSNKYSFVFTNKVSEVEKLEDIISQLSILWKLNDKTCFNLNLVIEETISNIILHGKYDSEVKKEITVIVENNESLINVKIIDNCIEFNPLNHDSDPEQSKIEDMKIGGLGIHFIKQLSENQLYERNSDKNILSFNIPSYE